MILYNVPGRTVADMPNETDAAPGAVPGIVGIKDATGDLGARHDLIARCAAGISRVYSGDDATALALMLLGGHGVISVTANVAPRA